MVSLSIHVVHNQSWTLPLSNSSTKGNNWKLRVYFLGEVEGCWRESSVSILSQKDHYCARLQKIDSADLFLLFCVLGLPGTARRGGVSFWLRIGEEIEVWAAENLRSGHCTRVYKTHSSSWYATTAPPKAVKRLSQYWWPRFGKCFDSWSFTNREKSWTTHLLWN